jgi:hypothetical protein
MRFSNRPGTRILLVILAGLLLPLPTFAGNDYGTIQGTVRDTGGKPVAGALVVVAHANSTNGAQNRMALTDRNGLFSVDYLLAGEYLLQVTMRRFLSSPKERVQVTPGNTERRSVSLQTALDVMRRAIFLEESDAEDMVWTLRSSRSTQPALRFTDAGAPVIRNFWSAYSGYFQFYSRSDSRSKLGSESMGSRFSVSLDLPENAKVTFSGQYNESPLQPKGASTLYEFTPADRHRTQIGINLRQGVILDDVFSAEEVKEIQLKYLDKYELFDTVQFEHGAEIGHAEGGASTNYYRPRASVSWVPNEKTVLSVAANTQPAGEGDDPIRGRDYFEQVSLPPALERNLHTEISGSRLIDDALKVSVAVFQDKANHRALFVSAPDGRRGLLIFDGRDLPSQGVRIHVNREFDGFEAGLGYTAATAAALSPDATLDEVRNNLTRRQFHVFTARFKTGFNLTNTELTAVYRWISKYAAGPIDPYQKVVEYNDPTLSISVAQNLPTWGTFPAKVQAIVDARNLFEQSFGSQKAQLAHSPRYLKGGINIRF